jgi:hypothetical protein
LTAQPQKPAKQLQGHRSGRGRANVPHPEEVPANVVAMIPIPAPPPDLLVRTREAWDEFWQSDLARLVDRRNEGRGIIYRYFALFDEWQRAYNAYRRRRVVKGSTGQPAQSPAFKNWMALEAAMAKLEREEGLTTKVRLLFGLQAGRIRDELDDLNDDFDDEDDEDEFAVPEGIKIVSKDGRRNAR